MGYVRRMRTKDFRTCEVRDVTSHIDALLKHAEAKDLIASCAVGQSFVPVGTVPTRKELN